jgi:hypothetical protein
LKTKIKKRKYEKILIALVVIITQFTLEAQVKTPQASPKSVLTK